MWPALCKLNEDKILISGGCVKNSNEFDVRIYEKSTNTIVPHSKLKTNWSNHQMVVSKASYIIVCGGENENK